MASLFPMLSMARAPNLPELAQAPQQIVPQIFGNAWQRAGIFGKLGYAGNVLQDTAAGLRGEKGGYTQDAVDRELQQQQLANLQSMMPPSQRGMFSIAPKEAMAAYLKSAFAAPEYEQADFGGSRGVFEKHSGTYQPFTVRKTLTPNEQYEQSPLAYRRRIGVAKAGIPPLPAPPADYVINQPGGR